MASIGNKPGISLIASPSPLAPTVAPFRLTQLSPVKATDDLAILAGVEYEIDGCDESYVTVDVEDWADCIRTAEKEFVEGLNYVDSFELAPLMAALKCRPGGLGGGSQEQFEERARRRLARVETRYLEDQVWIKIVAGTSQAVVGTGVEAAVAGLLGARIDDVNHPVLHLSVRNAALVASRIDDWQSIFGIGLVVSPGYADTTIGLTGAISIWGGEVVTNVVPSLIDNYTMAIAERQYIMAIECTAFKATVA